jgi:uncharacterized protein YjiS (DUF1127 family)
MPHLLALPLRFAALCAVWLARWEQRRALEDMTDDQLRDLGLSRVQAGAEAARPFWSGHPADARRRSDASACHAKDGLPARYARQK